VIKTISLLILVLFTFSILSADLLAQHSRLENAQALILKDAYAQAARECRKLLAGRNSSKVKAKAYYLLGVCFLKEAKYEEARKNFNIVLRRYSRSKFYNDAALGIADSYFLGQDFKQAKEYYEQFIKDFPRSELISIARRQLKACKKGNDYNNSYFSVQLGCFLKKGNAQKQRDKLINAGYQAYIVEVLASGFYHVRVGKFDNKREAKFLEKKLKNEGYSTKICP